MADGIPVALSIAGSDSSAGAGAQADLKTFSALGVYGLNALTCVVAETPGRVARIEPVAAEMVVAQVTLLLEHFPVAALKTGLLYSAEIVTAVAQILQGRNLPLVVDPVMVATSGDLLLRQEAVSVYERALFPLATVLTPNLDEASSLLGERVSDLSGMERAADNLFRRYRVPVLLKGGHLGGEQAIDLLCVGDEITEFSAPFTRGVHTHGTGCTYSAAIAAGLASGLELKAAIGRAKQFVSATIAQHFTWTDAAGRELHALNHAARF